ncbi:uncharacterized protein LOC108910587 [Anoplophora glabripennis]|uniref:uncharacterized protein LOC108910587 n=1 Tax=Anoplophora glabripennis TaxID=217634 RepID=UPI0008749FE4|nr:uncharacterized protein LOC108910587 [Anoplophora glabripennis]
MFSIYTDYFENSSIIDVIQLYWNSALLYLTDIIIALRDTQTKTILKFIEKLPEYFYFSDFQWTLLKTFSLILVINLILIVVVWRIYGKDICERFMKLSTLREIEELKASVSKLKLPKEHTPRI